MIIVVKVLAGRVGNDNVDGVELMKHARDNNLAAARVILERVPSASSFQVQSNADLDVGETPLIVAAKLGHAEMLQLLIDHGALLEMRDHGCQSTALAWAANRTKPACVRVLR